MDDMDKMLQRIAQAQKKHKEASKSGSVQQLALFPYFPDSASAVPTNIAKSGVFKVETSEDYFSNAIVYQNQKTILKFSGYHLSQTEADIFMYVLHLMRSKKFEVDSVRVTKAQIMQAIGLSRSGKNYAMLETSLKRLSESQFYIENNVVSESEHKKVKVVRLFDFNMLEDSVVLSIPAESAMLFENLSYLDTDKRKLIGARNSLAKSLQLYACAYQVDKKRIVDADVLKEKLGFKSPRSKFLVALKNSFDILEALEVLKDCKIEKDFKSYKVSWILCSNKT